MASKSDKQVTVEVNNNNGRSRSRSRGRSQSRGRGRSFKITVNSKNRGRRQNGRNKRQSNQRVRNIVNKQLRKQGVTGPKPAICQRATATLGTIGSNTSGSTEIEACILLNPVLVKDATGSTQFGPVQALGAQYSMWKLKYLNVKLTSMVGSSAVNGTAVRISLNPTSTPSSTSWSGLGARKHLDVTVGKNAVFRLKPADLGGPRDGWWLTNTNDNASDTLGPSIEIHTLGKTMSSYLNQQFTGGLFLVELASEWCFTGYAANPNLVNLMKSTDKQVNVSFEGDNGTPLIMKVPDTSHFARTAVARSSLPTTLARAGQNTTSDTVWQVLNTAVSAAEIVTPPPFNWLIKGGWWFVKLIAGRSRAGMRSFYVYPSYQDALSNKPALCTGSVPGGMRVRAAIPTTLQFTQMNQPSLGHGEVTATLGRSIPTPGDTFKVVLTIGQPLAPNTLVNQTWVNKTTTAPQGQHVVKIAKDTSNYTTMQGFTPISNVTWYTEDFQPSEEPPPISGLQVLVDSRKKADVYAVQQYLNHPSNTKDQLTSIFLVKVTTSFQVNNHLSYFYRAAGTGTAVESFKIRGATSEQNISFSEGWYLMTNTATFNPPAPPGWIWKNVELDNNTPYFVDQGMMHLIMSPPVGTQLLFEMKTTVSGTRNVSHFDHDENPSPVWCDALDAADVLELPTETDTESEEDEDEDDEADRFDLHSSYGSEPEDDDENNRVTLLSTLINQGMTVERATMITKRAFPTCADKQKRSVHMDLLASGLSPGNVWSHACEEARTMGTNHMPNVSGDRGHAE
uniref:Capsid polyprotein VP90 n=1 Tax=Human astrovirus-7 TaxID=38950 RepID=Q995V6_HASV7|nr:capsid protein precursor [Human astrovirus 7]